jgi:hypothetical protein
LVLIVTSQAAHATTCVDPRVEVRGELAPRWLEPVLDLCDALGKLSDLDPDARLRLVPAEDDVIVEVRLPDGRSTMRRLHSADDLRLTVEALMTLPPARTAPAPAAKVAPQATRSAAETPPEDPPRAAPTAVRRAGVEVEGGAVASSRLAGAPALGSIGPAAHASLRIDDWLFGVNARWDAYQKPLRATDRSFEMDSVAAGFGVGRRFVIDPSVRFDFGGALLVVNEAQSTESDDGEQAGSVADVRLGTGARAWIGRSNLRFLSQLDAEVSVSRLRHEIRIDPTLPPLPTWSVGLGVGVGWTAP